MLPLKIRNKLQVNSKKYNKLSLKRRLKIYYTSRKTILLCGRKLFYKINGERVEIIKYGVREY